MRLYDAHNHLQDDRLASRLEPILLEIERTGVARMVVNGSCEQDWPQVAALARRCPHVLPSFGYHPWYVQERTPDWKRELVRFLDSCPAAVGEIGLDKWILERRPSVTSSPANVGQTILSAGSGDFPVARSEHRTRKSGEPADKDVCPTVAVASLPEQEEAFVWQLRLAAERNLPVSIHCLQAWGPLLEILRREPRPQCGFVLHSYGGSMELVEPLARLGAHFSLPGYFAHERKHRQREAFLKVPPDRLLLETDAPDQLLPDALNRHPLVDATGSGALNHPANIAAVYDFAAGLFREPVGQLAARVEENFLRLFGGICS